MFSLMAPKQPKKPVIMMMVPMAMTRLAADSEGKLGEKVAKLPWDTDNQMPTPSSPQPHSCRDRERELPLGRHHPAPDSKTQTRGEPGCQPDAVPCPRHAS